MTTKMPTETLYAAGWRQGTVLKAELDAVATILDTKSRKAVEARQTHEVWVVVTQDCTLDRTEVSSNSPAIELRQVHDAQPPTHWGIHARKFLLDAESGHYLVDGKPASFVSPRLISDAEVVEHLFDLGDDRVLALKTWLGNRYDRPAVPPELVPLARAIATAVGSDTRRPIGNMVRDVYMEFGGQDTARTFSLFAVTTPDADPAQVREWLAEGALEVSPDLGTPTALEVGTAAEVSLSLIESAFCADLSQITWADNESPEGAT
jgi:hypothetical protein